jgi:hypothetical protein
VSLGEIIESIASFIWDARGLVAGLGQAAAWAVLVLLLAITLAWAFGRWKKPPEPQTPNSPPDPAPTRLQQWRSMLTLARSGAGTRRPLYRELRRLALSVLAHTEGTNAEECASRIAAGRLAVEECMLQLFEAEDVLDEARIANVVGSLEKRLGTTGS